MSTLADSCDSDQHELPGNSEGWDEDGEVVLAWEGDGRTRAENVTTPNRIDGGKTKPRSKGHSPLAWIDAVAASRHPLVNTAARLVMAYIARHADGGGYCFPKAKTLADETDRGERTVTEALDRLVRAGWISAWRMAKRNGHLGGYRFLVHAGALGLAPVPDDLARAIPERAKLHKSCIPDPQIARVSRPARTAGQAADRPARTAGHEVALGLEVPMPEGPSEPCGGRPPRETDGEHQANDEPRRYVETRHVRMVCAVGVIDAQRRGDRARTDDTEAQGVEAGDWGGDPWGEAQGQGHPLSSSDEVPPASEPPAEHEEVAA